MVLNASFNNISVISWQSVLLVDETRVPRENIEPAESHWQNHTMLYRVHLAWMGFELAILVVIGTDCVGNCTSNYHTITTVPVKYKYVVLLSYIYFCERWKPTFLLYYKYNIKLTSKFHFFFQTDILNSESNCKCNSTSNSGSEKTAGHLLAGLQPPPNGTIIIFSFLWNLCKISFLLFNDDLIWLSVLIYNNQSASLTKFIKSIQTFNQKVAKQWAYEH